MSESMVERVARALCRDGGFQDTDSLDHRVRFGSDPPVVDTQPIWRRFEKEARAAIEAMREPTEKMKRAVIADARSDELIDSPVAVMLMDSWRAMIAAALAESDAP
jgi:hypothetical protein